MKVMTMLGLQLLIMSCITNIQSPMVAVQGGAFIEEGFGKNADLTGFVVGSFA